MNKQEQARLKTVLKELVRLNTSIGNRLWQDKMYRETDEIFDEQEIEQCQCEMDGFQGAISTHKCPIHKEPSKTETITMKTVLEANERGYLSGREDLKKELLEKIPEFYQPTKSLEEWAFNDCLRQIKEIINRL